MSVFHNLYSDSFQKYDEQIQQQDDTSKYVFFTNYLTSLLNTFRWGGKDFPKLPRNLHEQFLQRSGCTGGFMDGDKFKIFPIFPTGKLLEDGLFSSYVAVAVDGKQYDLNLEDVEICFNNCNGLGYINQVAYFASKTSDSILAVDSALMKAITPSVIACNDEGQLNVISSMLDKIKNLKPFRALVRSKFDKDGLQRVSAFDNRENDILALWDVYARYRNLYYTTFGTNNVEITKRERLTEAEGKGNDEIVRYSLLDDMYHNRLDFCKRVKEHFGKEITCELRRDSASVYELNLSNEEKIKNEEIIISRGANIDGKEEVNIDEDKVERYNF